MTTQSPSSKQSSPASFDSARIAAQLRKWQERLLDLTKSNPLLGINRSRVSKLRVTTPDLADVFSQLVVEEAKLKMPFVRRRPSRGTGRNQGTEEPPGDFVVEPGDVMFDAKPEDLWRRLRRIFDNARTTVEERGVTTLHMAIGILGWDDPALGESASPLWLIPCQFEYVGPNAPLRLERSDEEIQLNPALELYLRERQKVLLPPLPEDPTADTLREHLNAVRQAVREQHWTVRDEAWLSTFSFESLVIYQDLKVMAEAAGSNSIVAALSRAGLPPEGSEALGEDLDDLPPIEQVPIPVLPADSSQLRALALAAGGRNLVIHGPPGTGKSQTIANLIADALRRGKRVLFVSAKMAALDVVHERLAERGLGRFCLEAHSTKAGKAKIIEELKRTLETKVEGNAHLLKEQLEELLEIRRQLNTYVRELHQRREPLGLSVFRAIGRAARLRQTPEVPHFPLGWSDPLTVDRTQLRGVIELLSDLGAQAEVYDDRANHPWRGFDPEAANAAPETIELALRKVLSSSQALLESFASLRDTLGTDGSTLTMDGIRSLSPGLRLLAECDHLPPGWQKHSVEDLGAAAKLLAEAAEQTRSRQEHERQYVSSLAVPPAACRELLSPLRAEYRRWTRVFRPGYWQWRQIVRARLQDGVSDRLADLHSYLALAEELIACDEWFKEQQASLGKFVSAPMPYEERLLRTSAKRYQAAAALRASLMTFEAAAAHESSLTEKVREAARKIAGAAEKEELDEAPILDHAWPSGFVDGAQVPAGPLDALRRRCTEVLSALHRQHEWELCAATMRRCETAGLKPCLDALGDVSVRFASTVFERRFYTQWVAQVIGYSSALKLFSAERWAERVERFRQLDERILVSSLNATKEAASNPMRAVLRARANLGDLGEVGVLRRELQKRRRIKPLRKLFSEIPHALQALKPCMLMSPLSVSTFLKPGSVEFDIAVFDEASQLPTPEAIPSILRAKQVVVAGDENQLPPTSFFQASSIFDDEVEEEEDTDEDMIPLESLLDDCVAIDPVFDPTRLIWHYRSHDERLINFSNHYFYNNSLITFPSAITESEGRGVHHRYLPDGVWDRGRSRTNRQEASAVARLIIEQLDSFPERSIGVAAMNAMQREAIEVALNELIEQRPDLAPLLATSRSEPFFIKSLENVQGDERDTIIISVGYAKAQTGALSLNFGPLNREGGWRRLNVLVTRAKWQTILVTSLRSQDLAAVQPGNRGAFMLRKFIEYAENAGALPVEPAVLVGAETNDFEDAVAEALRDRGLLIDEQIGVGGYRIDLAVRDPRAPGRYLLGIECDGATYHSARTARDRDLLRQQVLRAQGWRLHRLWSTEWFYDRQKAIAGVLRSVELAMQGLAPTEGPEAPLAPPSVAGVKKVSEETPGSSSQKSNRRFRSGEPYRKYRAASTLNGRVIMDPAYVQELASHIASIVRIEAPIHEDLLLERLKEICGVSRAGSNIVSNTHRALRLAIQQGEVRRDEKQQMLYGQAPLKNFRTPGEGVERSISQVAREEIELAVSHVVEDQFGFPREELPRAVGELLGLGKATVSLSETVGDVVDALVECGRLRLSGPNVYLP